MRDYKTKTQAAQPRRNYVVMIVTTLIMLCGMYSCTAAWLDEAGRPDYPATRR